MILAWALVACGCNLTEIGLPDDSRPEIRLALGGFVVAGTGVSVVLSRPLDHQDEVDLHLPWLDLAKSSLSVEWTDSRTDAAARSVLSAAPPSFQLSQKFHSGFANVPATMDRIRLRGKVRWNASVPFSFSGARWLTENVDIAPEASDRIAFDRDWMVSGELALRWPRFALDADGMGLPDDSLPRLVDDWNAICALRGESGRILFLDRSIEPKAYRLTRLDSTVLRQIVGDPSLGRIFFAPGDSIWMPSDGKASMVVRTVAPENTTAILDAWIDPEPPSSVTLTGSSSLVKLPVLPISDSGVAFGLFHLGMNSRNLLVLQVSGACPSFVAWRHAGGTTPPNPPTGRVAPFDGYFCLSSPDTMTFPIGKRL